MAIRLTVLLVASFLLCCLSGIHDFGDGHRVTSGRFSAHDSDFGTPGGTRSHGHWYDDFEDEDNVTATYNVNVTGGDATLVTSANLTSDDWNDGNANGWLVQSGSWGVQNGEYHQTAGSSDTMSILQGKIISDGVVGADVMQVSSPPQDSGLVFRRINSMNYYAFRLLPASNVAGIFCFNGGVLQNITGGTTAYTVDHGTWYDMKVVFSGSSIRGYINDTLVLQATDSTHTVGAVGLIANGHAAYDNFTCADTVDSGSLISETITLPSNSYWDRLEWNSTTPGGSEIRVSLLDPVTSQPVPGFTGFNATPTDMTTLDPEAHPSFRLKASFSGGLDVPVLHDWSVWWKDNGIPQVSGLTVSDEDIFRGQDTWVNFTVTDDVTSPGDMEVTLEPFHDTGGPVSGIVESHGNGVTGYYVHISTTHGIEPGWYGLNVTVTDEMGLSGDFSFDRLVMVRNNPPVMDELTIGPAEPVTRDDLGPAVTAASDAESTTVQVNVTWYEGAVTGEGFANDTVPADMTSKGDIWYCVAVAWDGLDESDPFTDSLTVLNSPPVHTGDVSIEMPEDGEHFGPVLAETFDDLDGDELLFRPGSHPDLTIQVVTGNGTLHVVPAPDWAGEATFNITATDGAMSATLDVTVKVEEVNDAPVLVKVGPKTVGSAPVLEFTVKEDEEFSATLVATDVDDTALEYGMDLVARGTWSIDEATGHISFTPDGSDVGVIDCNVTVSDGRGGEDGAALRFTVVDVPDPPSVSITSPGDGDEFLEGENVTFSCEIADVDAGDVFTIEWLANKTAFGTGNDMMSSSLAPGIYNITARVTDSAGLQGEASVGIKVTAVSDGDGGDGDGGDDPGDGADGTDGGDGGGDGGTSEEDGDDGSRSSATDRTVLLVAVLAVVALVVVLLLVFRKRQTRKDGAGSTAHDPSDDVAAPSDGPPQVPAEEVPPQVPLGPATTESPDVSNVAPPREP